MTHNVVLRYSGDFPQRYRIPRYDGLWIDASALPVGFAEVEPRSRNGSVVAEPTTPVRFEYRSDGEAAEVWVIRWHPNDEETTHQ